MNIKSFYEIALLEGEGLGTAYEYFQKQRILDNNLKSRLKDKKIKKVLIYGLPKRYGYSLDFFMYCKKIKADVYLYENRKEKINKLFKYLKRLNLSKPKIIQKLDTKYDLILSCEVLQNITKEKRIKILSEFKKISKDTFIFVPNKHNQSHNKISRLKSLDKKDFMFIKEKKEGFIDMPPFPPGIKRKKKVKSKLFINILQLYTYLEKYFPKFIKKRFSHIFYIYI